MKMIQCGTAKARSGQKAWGQLVVKRGPKQVRLPVIVINGSAAGEHVVLMANQHGGEINGVEAIRRFAEQVNPRRLKGTIFAIPSANPRAALLANECWPEDDDPGLVAKLRGCPYTGQDQNRNNCKYNMNRKWPGKPDGLLVERMTYEIWNHAIMAAHARASLVLDFHCHRTPSAVYARIPAEVELGVVSGVPTVIHTRGGIEHRLAEVVCGLAGVRSLVIELGGQLVLDPVSIEDGRRSIFNLLKFWGMLPGRPQYPRETLILDPWRNDVLKDRTWRRPSWLDYRVKHTGLVMFHRQPYNLVRKGEIVATVTDPFTGRIVEECRAGMSGVVLNHRISVPVGQKGEAIFRLSMLRQRVRTADYIRRLNPESFRTDVAREFQPE
jgi:hypothetical protein